MDKKIFDKLKQLSTVFAELEKQYKASADGPMVVEDKDMEKHKTMMEMQDMVWRAMSNVHSRIDYLSENLSNWIYDHQKNHTPNFYCSQQT